jgi:hypothetical protein
MIFAQVISSLWSDVRYQLGSTELSGAQEWPWFAHGYASRRPIGIMYGRLLKEAEGGL